MGVYNGARFLWEQYRSLADQSYTDWRLVVRDDGSTDGTHAVLARMAADPRVEVVCDGFGRLGVVQNYNRLLSTALERGADAVFLADQDDVWTKDKIRRGLGRLTRLEARHPQTPILLHTDLTVVDAKLFPRRMSFMRSEGLRHAQRRPLRTLAIQNFVTGCTVLVNRAALERALPIPPAAVMHDWWLALCTAATGHIVFDPEPSVLYRQHGSNTVGAQGYWRNLAAAAGRLVRWRRAMPAELHRALEQAWWAGAWIEPHNSVAADRLQAFAELWRSRASAGAKLAALRRLGIRRQDELRHALLQWRLVVSRPLQESDFRAGSEKNSPER